MAQESATAEAKKLKAQEAVQGMIDEKLEESGIAKTPEALDALKKNQEEMTLKLEAWEKSMSSMRSKFALPGAEEEAKKGKFSYGRLAGALKRGNLAKYAPYEYDLIKEYHKVAGEESELAELDAMTKTSQQLGVDTTGGYLVGPEISSELIENLRDRPLLSKLGARVISGIKGGEFRMPKKTGSATMYHVAEGTAPTESNLTFGQVTMRPHVVKALVRVSDNLNLLSNPDIEAIVRDDITLGMALSMDLKGFRGSGSSSEPTGLVNLGTGLNSVSCGPGAITLAKLHEFPATIEQDLALKEDGSYAYVFNPRTIDVVRQLKDSYGRYHFRPDTYAEQKMTILGHPFYTSNQVPKNLTVGGTSNCAEIYFGNWKEFIIGIWGTLRFKVFDQANLASGAAAGLLDELWFYVVAMYDVMVRHNESFAICTDTSS